MRKGKKTHYVYITESKTRALYIGVTDDLRRYIQEHEEKTDSISFTARYYVNRLVYFETYERVYDAIAREKQLKKWRREKKVKLINSVNPKWIDLSAEPFFDERMII